MSGVHTAFGGGLEMAPATTGKKGRAVLTKGATGTWTNCGRTALMVVLRRFKEMGMKRIHLPAFVCESVVQAVIEEDLPWSFYEVSHDLDGFIDYESGDGVLVIHYFGWPNRTITAADWVIEDFSHALLSEFSPNKSHASFFSTRKFSGINAGGWCSVKATPALEADTELDDIQEVLHHAQATKRDYLANSNEEIRPEIEASYVNGFASVEKYFDCQLVPRGLSSQVATKIDQEDWMGISCQRRNNWITLHELLAGQVDGLFADIPDSVYPLGYVLRLNPDVRDLVRARLMGARIYTAIHWPLPSQVDPAQFPLAAGLAASVLTIPIDHRYGDADMRWLAKQLLEASQQE